MPRKPIPAVEPEIRGKVVEAVRRDMKRDYVNALQGPDKLQMLGRLLLKARSDLPKYRPIERELLLEYISRRKRYFLLIADSISNVSPAAASESDWIDSRSECKQLWEEIEELEGLIWGEKSSKRMRRVMDQIWNDEFWRDLQESGVGIREALRTIDALMPPVQGRPITKRPIAVQALQLKLSRSLSWSQITRRLCGCSKSMHDALCQDRLKKEVKIVKTILSKYGIEFPKQQGQHSLPSWGENPSPFPPRKK